MNQPRLENPASGRRSDPHLAKTEPLPRRRRYLRGTRAEGGVKGKDGPERGAPSSLRRRLSWPAARRPEPGHRKRHGAPRATPAQTARGAGKEAPVPRAPTRAHAAAVPKRRLRQSRGFTDVPRLLAADPTPIAAALKGSRRLGCHERGPGGLRRTRGPAGRTRPTSCFPAAYLLPPPCGDGRGDPGGRADGGPARPRAGGETPAVPRRASPQTQTCGGGGWELTHGPRADGRPGPRRLRANPQQTNSEQAFKNVSAKWMMASSVRSPKFSFFSFSQIQAALR